MERNTRQREVIKQVFESEARPLNPLEILDLAKVSLSRVSLATVYRAIKELIEEKWLTPVKIPGQSFYYEKDRHHHHHHFYCESCSKVFEVEGCVPVKSLTPKGFSLESHEILLSGRCPACVRH
jgi:Fur family transcriptional regulator, ferric uptake regulator